MNTCAENLHHLMGEKNKRENRATGGHNLWTFAHTVMCLHRLLLPATRW